MRRTRFALALAAAALIATTVPAAAAGPAARPDAQSDGPTAGPTVDTSSALVQLKGAPLSTYSKTKPPQGKKIDFSSATVKSYRAQLSALRNSFKKWLATAAPKAQVVKGYDLSLNAVVVKLNGTSLATLRTSSLVARAEYEGLYYPTAEDPDLALISAPEAWAVADPTTPANAGTGIKVAIIDTGIDQTHPCFSDAGYPAVKQLGDTRFTNNKVIVARVFSNKTPSQGYTAEALQEHGTHVAGTVACNFGTPATVGGVAISHPISGVAPRALLGNYNIFPGALLNARSEDILDALDAAYMDGMDIANLSLGGGASGIQDLLTVAVDNLDQANMVIAVAAGNSAAGDLVPPHTQAPGHYTIESPGSAARALTAGAATVGHFIATPVVATSGTYPAASGDFATVSTDTTATLAAVAGSGANGLSTACTALPAGSLTGKIALITRGGCTFSEKIRSAQDAGAILVLVGNSSAGDPIAMGRGGIPNEPTIPAYMVSIDNAAALKADDGTSVTIQAAPAYFISGNNDFMAAFSSQGPTDVDYRVKPDVVAPGVNVLSSVPHQFCDATVDTHGCFAFFQGTSMATPHLAGSAAVVKWAHPTWAAWQIRSAIVNTADQVVKKSTSTTLEKDVNIVGAGRENLLSAVDATIFLSSVSISFGAVPSGSGQTRTFTLAVTNAGAAAADLSVTAATGTGVAFSVSPATIAAGTTASVTITATFDKGAGAGDHQAQLNVMAGATPLAHAAVYTFVK